eukprot:3353351-Rhodomonas_salina.1
MGNLAESYFFSGSWLEKVPPGTFEPRLRLAEGDIVELRSEAFDSSIQSRCLGVPSFRRYGVV